MHPFVTATLDALGNGHFPEHYSIDFSYRQFGDSEMAELATVLSVPPKGEPVTYNLSHNPFTAAGIKALCHALTTRVFSSPLVLDLSHSQLNDDALKVLANALASGHFPCFVTLKLGYNRFSTAGAHFIAQALASGRCPSDLTLDFEGNRAFSETGASHFAESLASKRWPAGLTLNLKMTGMKDSGMEQLAERLVEGPEHLNLNVSFNGLSSKSMCILTKTLPHAPENLTLNLSSNSIGDEGARHLASALRSNAYPHTQTLILDFNGLTDAGAQCLALALSDARPEQRISLSLAGNNLTPHSTTAFWQLLKRQSCPQLTLNFKNNQLALLSVKNLASTIIAGKIPRGTVINLAKNKLKDDDLDTLWPALTSTTSPPCFTLILSENALTGHSLSRLLNVAEELPRGFTLDLSDNSFTDLDRHHLIEELKKKMLPIGCRLILNTHSQANEQITINQLTQRSFQTALGFLTFLQGVNQNHPLSCLPTEIIAGIFALSVPHANPASVLRLHQLADKKLTGIYQQKVQKKPAFFKAEQKDGAGTVLEDANALSFS
ncbi:hypothetical protein [Legionella erythra]|uniref:Leucine-rich repeat-containing protein (Substrate of the Dot/Icm secretion system) n=1 Tax=Legionella erythra TaxID=448 RepID=A0A0W0TRV4_LEGER|nr:hypothetical protein [Legionella erythra]KTC98372.1 hypothetical protein Lery_0935 [Legionella erythra]